LHPIIPTRVADKKIVSIREYNLCILQSPHT
jgi:hypothetical protein